ncbi:MAG: HAD family hydrolase [Nanobdellota archaeon]
MKFAAIFDMDGVLVDTHDLIWSSINKTLRRYGVHLTTEDINQYLGKSLEDDVKDWNEKYNLSLNLNQYKETLWAEQRRTLKKIGPDKNLLSLLDQLNENKVLKGVGTSSGRKRAKSILKSSGLRRYFPILVAAEDVDNHKPSPDVFLRVAKLLSMKPEDCVVFEDSYSGILAAKVANMKAIGYHGKHNSIKDLIDADLIIKNFSEVNLDKLSIMFNSDFQLNNHFSLPTGERYNQF